MNLVFCLVLALAVAGCSSRHQVPTSPPNSNAGLPAHVELPPQITSFIEAKETHAKKLSEKLKAKVPHDVWTFFHQARRGDWPAANSTFETCLEKRKAEDDGSAKGE